MEIAVTFDAQADFEVHSAVAHQKPQQIGESFDPKLFTLREARRGDLRTSVFDSNMARIGTKLRQNAFRKICNF